VKKLLLCVDDERVVLEGIRSQLKRYLSRDIQLELAESAEDALEILEEYNPRPQDFPLILTDHIMPGMKGDQLLIQIHQRFPQTIKILLTGQADAHSVANALNSGGLYRYITKPWEEQDLMMTVQEGLDSFETHWELEEKNSVILRDREAFHRFVPKAFLDWLIGPDMEYSQIQGGVHRNIDLTLAVIDIHRFKELSSTQSPAQSFLFLENLFQGFTLAITENQGLIEKYMGDCILALFPEPQLALQAARTIRSQLRILNHNRSEENLESLEIGVGIHHGPVVICILGGQHQLQTSVLGEAVNKAFQLEAYTREQETDVLLSQEAYEKLSDSQGLVGFDIPTRIYRDTLANIEE